MNRLKYAFVKNDLKKIQQLELSGANFSKKNYDIFKHISNYGSYTDAKYHYFHHELFEYFLFKHMLPKWALEKTLQDIIDMSSKNTQELEYFFSHIPTHTFEAEDVYLYALNSDAEMVFDKLQDYYELSNPVLCSLLEEAIVDYPYQKLSLTILNLAVQKGVFEAEKYSIPHFGHNKHSQNLAFRLMSLGVSVPSSKRDIMFSQITYTHDIELMEKWSEFYPLSDEQKQKSLYEYCNQNYNKGFEAILSQVNRIENLSDYVQILKNYADRVETERLTLSHFPQALVIIDALFQYDKKAFHYVVDNLAIYNPITVKMLIDEKLSTKPLPKRKKI